MPTEEFKKGKMYYKSKDDKEYKELGTGTLEFSSIEEEEKDIFEKIEELSDKKGFKIEIDIKTKKYKKKRFKKLLMSYRIQRNDAEILTSITSNKKYPVKRDDFGLISIILKSIESSFEIIKKERNNNMNIQEIAKEIIESLEERKKGTEYYNFVTGKIDYYEKARGKGTKQYTIRRIDILQDELKQMKKDIIEGKYDIKRK